MERPPLPKRLKRFVRYYLVRAALFAVGLLPARVAGRLGGMFGALAFAVARGERRKALESLSRAFPDAGGVERRALARACFVHLGRAAFEITCIREIDRDVERWVEWPEDARRELDRALERRKGVVFVTGHVGNWELLARRAALAGYPCQTIAKATTDPRLTSLVEKFRSSSGLKSIWRGEEGVGKRMRGALEAGEILGLLIDQDTRVPSVFVPFFGHPASTPRAAADLVLRTGAALVMGFCPRTPEGKYRVSMKELAYAPGGELEKDVVELTARMTREIEEAIRRTPEQWVWMHRRWKTQP